MKRQKLFTIYEKCGFGRSSVGKQAPEDEMNSLLDKGWNVVFATPTGNSVQYIIQEP